MLFGTMLIDALHPALENAEEAFNGVGVDRTAPVFANAMPHEVMLGEIAGEKLVLPGFVGHHDCAAVNVSLQDRHNVLGLQALDHHASRLAGGAVNETQNFIFVGIAPTLFLAFWFHTTVNADKGFIHFDNPSVGAENQPVAILHGLADTMSHEPCGFQGHAQGAVKLIGAYTLLARANQEHRLKPDMQLDVAGLEDGPDLHGERLATAIALVGAYTGAVAFQLAYAVLAGATVRANGSIGPHAGLDKLICCLFIVKVGGAQYRHDVSPSDVDTVPRRNGYVKYNNALFFTHLPGADPAPPAGGGDRRGRGNRCNDPPRAGR